jgi:hypothetical protein
MSGNNPPGSHLHGETAPAVSARPVPVLLGIICAILLVAALYFAEAILAPVASALFIIALV